MTAPTGLLAPALRECVQALEELRLCGGDIHRAQSPSLSGAADRCERARIRAKAALQSFSERTPSEW